MSNTRVHMPSWHSYPSIYNLGHRAVADLLKHPVNVEEKADGSQFSFGVDEEGTLRVRSKGAEMLADAPERMFTLGVEHIKTLKDQLRVGWTYRGEYLRAPKHNSLCYDRFPRGHVILFDVNTDEEGYLSYEAKKAEADRLGLETVPLLFSGVIDSIDKFRDFLDNESVLGGQKIEGVVVKPREYNVFGLDKKVLMAKFVSEHFKEVHSKEWKNSNPTQNDILLRLATEYTTPARWQKAVMHLAERGQIENSPRDIGLVIKEVPEDVLKECADEIKEKLFAFAWPHVRRMLTRGLPEWYKDQLLKSQPVGETNETENVEGSTSLG